MTFKEELIKYYSENCLVKPAEGKFFFGKLPGTRYESQWYPSCAIYDVNLLEGICKEYDKKITSLGHTIWNKYQITGRDWSAIPLLTAIPMWYKMKYGVTVNSFLCRSQRKTYGQHNIVEGRPNNLPVLIVDDICNSTDSYRYCANIVKNELRLELLPYIFAVFNKYRAQVVGSSADYDRYLGPEHKALSIITGDEEYEYRRNAGRTQNIH